MNFIQHSPPHPAEMLKELYFEPLKLSATKAAENFNIPKRELGLIINGRKGITPSCAEKLAACLKTTVQFWLNMQTNYEVKKNREKKT